VLGRHVAKTVREVLRSAGGRQVVEFQYSSFNDASGLRRVVPIDFSDDYMEAFDTKDAWIKTYRLDKLTEPKIISDVDAKTQREMASFDHETAFELTIQQVLDQELGNATSLGGLVGGWRYGIRRRAQSIAHSSNRLSKECAASMKKLSGKSVRTFSEAAQIVLAQVKPIKSERSTSVLIQLFNLFRFKG